MMLLNALGKMLLGPWSDKPLPAEFRWRSARGPKNKKQRKARAKAKRARAARKVNR